MLKSNSLHVIGVFIGLMSFDTVSHAFVVRKIAKFGIQVTLLRGAHTDRQASVANTSQW